MIRSSKVALLSSSALLLFALNNDALAQTDSAGTNSAGSAPTELPSVEVTAPKQTAVAPKKPKPVIAARHPVSPTTAQSSTSSSSVTQPSSQAAQLAAKNGVFDQARGNIFTTVGTTSDTIGHDTIQELPGGANPSVEQVLLQTPGVSQDSAASGLLHVRNDHANLQFRINGVLLPDGVTGFGSIFDTSFIGSMSLVTGALPAEYGLRTTGLVDITTRTDLFNNSGQAGVYGGSHGTITPSIQYGGTFGSTCPTIPAPPPGTKALPTGDCFPGVQYFFTGRYFFTNWGLEPPTAAYNPIHDQTRQEKGFAYLSTFVDPYTRLSLLAGTFTGSFQIPNNPGQPVGLNGNPPVTSAFGVTNFNSALLNENQYEDTQWSVLALQRSINGFDGQLSYFTRYDRLHFTPDP